jgi:hypothetical protein
LISSGNGTGHGCSLLDRVRHATLAGQVQQGLTVSLWMFRRAF